MLQSAELESPFAQPAPLDDDLRFCARAMALLGPCLPHWRFRQVEALRLLAKALRPWEQDLQSLMAPSVKAVAATKKPAFLLACAILSRWPDLSNALRFVTGYKVVGEIENSGLFRPVQPSEDPSFGLPALLGQAAVDNFRLLQDRVKPSDLDDELRQTCLDEIALGHARGPYSAAEMDAESGIGGWRPLERFMILQSDKCRPIDSGKRPGHNAAARERETIYTTSVDAFQPLLLLVREWLSCSAFAQGFPCFARFMIGTEDMKHAYRQCPVHPDNLCVTCTAYWDNVAQDHRFIVSQGLPFGLSSAVLCFNRTPTFLAALCRRVCAAPVLQFFNDSGIADLECARGSAQAAMRACFSFAGAELDPGKSQPPAACRVFLGLSANLALANSDDCISFDLKPGFREALADEVRAILSDGRLNSGRASKLRGKFGWAASGTYGRCGRAGLAPLVTRQFTDTSDELTPALRDCLRFHLHLAEFVPPRLVSMAQAQPRPVRIYSDASYEPSAQVPARLGFVIFPSDDHVQPLGMSMDISDAVLGRFQVRQTQINGCEALAGVIIPANAPDLLRGRDIVWFVDNQAACQILMKGSSSLPDIAVIAAVTQLLFTRLGCRVYFEYVPSDSNPSDGLSRDGLQDSWTLSQGWRLLPAVTPEILFTAFDSLSHALLLV